jgi:hypothetical protein
MSKASAYYRYIGTGINIIQYNAIQKLSKAYA